MILKKRNILYSICTVISLITFNKIDKMILFSLLLYISYMLISKEQSLLKIYNK